MSSKFIVRIKKFKVIGLWIVIILVGAVLSLFEGKRRASNTKTRIEKELSLLAVACWAIDSVKVDYLKFISLDSGLVVFNISSDTMVFALDEKLNPSNEPNVISMKINEPCKVFQKLKHNRQGGNLALAK